jgi:hypothetical protein
MKYVGFKEYVREILKTAEYKRTLKLAVGNSSSFARLYDSG